ncbi:MAG: phosphopantetheine-binding protein [Acidobacteriota bacterium]
MSEPSHEKPADTPGTLGARLEARIRALETAASPDAVEVPAIDRASVTRRIKQLLAELVDRPWHELLRGDRLRQDLGFDNASLVQLAALVQDAFKDLGVTVSGNEVVARQTLGHLSDLVWNKYLAELLP